MTWRLAGQFLTRTYPDLGKDIPAWYPEPGPATETILELTEDKLVVALPEGSKLVVFRITSDNPDTREGAAARAKAETVALQPQALANVTPTVEKAPVPPASGVPFVGTWQGTIRNCAKVPDGREFTLDKPLTLTITDADLSNHAKISGRTISFSTTAKNDQVAGGAIQHKSP